MHWVQYFIFVGAMVYGATIAKEWRFGEPFGPVAPNLRFIVTVDGKSYFADQESKRNWTEARDYCKSMGMKLASITSQAQADALQNSYDDDYFRWGYWTSGRDAHLIRQFSWDETGQEISSQYLKLYPVGAGMYKTCVYYDVSPNNRSFIGMNQCGHAGYTLCET